MGQSHCRLARKKHRHILSLPRRLKLGSKTKPSCWVSQTPSTSKIWWRKTTVSKSLGWVSAYRSLLDDPQFKDPDALALWVRLLLRANYEDKAVKVNNQTIHLKRGQFIAGRQSLSASSGVQESKVERLLKRWVNEQQIEQQTFNKFRVISITKYDEYQSSEQQSDEKVNTDNNTNKLNKELKSFSKPNLGELGEYFCMAGMSIIESKAEAKKFIDHYESIGWVVGKAKAPMVKWKSSASGWYSRKKKYENTRQNESNAIDFSSTGWSEPDSKPAV